MLLEESLDTRRHLWEAELRHSREEVVLDLEVEVSHNPVDSKVGLHVERMLGSILDPVDVLIGLGHGQVSVGHGEVREDVVRANRVVDQVDQEGLWPGVSTSEEAVEDQVAYNKSQTWSQHHEIREVAAS